MNDETTLLSNGLPPPPIPQRLREMLKDYPEHLEKLQKVLNKVVEKPAYTPPFEVAIWALEGQTSTFIREAQAELDAAQAGGDVEAIARAEAKEDLMFCVGDINNGLKGLHELWDYFQAHKENFK
jgi:hypothetical protein